MCATEPKVVPGRVPKKKVTFTIMLNEREQEAVERLRRLRRSTRASAVRAAIGQALHLAEALEEGKQVALVDKRGNAVIVHFIM